MIMEAELWSEYLAVNVNNGTTARCDETHIFGSPMSKEQRDVSFPQRSPYAQGMVITVYGHRVSWHPGMGYHELGALEGL